MYPVAAANALTKIKHPPSGTPAPKDATVEVILTATALETPPNNMIVLRRDYFWTKYLGNVLNIAKTVRCPKMVHASIDAQIIITFGMRLLKTVKIANSGRKKPMESVSVAAQEKNLIIDTIRNASICKTCKMTTLISLRTKQIQIARRLAGV